MLDKGNLQHQPIQQPKRLMLFEATLFDLQVVPSTTKLEPRPRGMLLKDLSFSFFHS